MFNKQTKIVEIMKSLIESLQAKTQSFKQTFLNEIEKWSRGHFDVMVDRYNWNDEQWCEFLGLEPRFVEGRFGGKSFTTFPANFYNTGKSRVYDREKGKAVQIARMGVDEYVAKEQKNADIHFENSLIKLADRIVKKGLNESAIEIQSAHVGVNLEITLTDGNQTVRAFTIIASGEVQRPHYRYLIK